MRTAGELGGEVIHRIDSRSGFHHGGAVQQSPVTLGNQFHQEDLQQNFGKLLPHAHPGAPPEGDVLKPGGVSGGFGHEALGLEVFFVGEDVSHIVGVADAVDDVPAFGNLETLENSEGMSRYGPVQLIGWRCLRPSVCTGLKGSAGLCGLTLSSKVFRATLKPPGTGGLILSVSLMTHPVYFNCSKDSVFTFWRSMPCSSWTAGDQLATRQSHRVSAPPSWTYLLQQFLPQSTYDLGVQAQEHDQRGGGAGCGFMAPEQQLCGGFLDGLETDARVRFQM